MVGAGGAPNRIGRNSGQGRGHHRSEIEGGSRLVDKAFISSPNIQKAQQLNSRDERVPRTMQKRIGHDRPEVTINLTFDGLQRKQKNSSSTRPPTCPEQEHHDVRADQNFDCGNLMRVAIRNSMNAQPLKTVFLGL